MSDARPGTPSQDERHPHTLAEAALTTLRQHRIPPTPRNYELFYRYHDGGGETLKSRLDAYLHQSDPGLDQLDAIYDATVGADQKEADAVQRGADDLAGAAEELVAHVASNQGAIRSYGSTLTNWTKRLAEQAAASELIKAVAALTAETNRAFERNRALEDQLSASVARVTKLQKDLAQVRQETTRDGLTGIANRKAFESKLSRAIAQTKTDVSATFTLLLVDVDHFKRFNDTHGHRTGDHVLRLVARLLADNVKGKDTAARYGGEEFAILLAGADLDVGVKVAERIRRRLESQRLIKRGTGEAVGQITVSIGVAQHRPGESGTSLVERADTALYEAKRLGRNRVCAAPRPDATDELY